LQASSIVYRLAILTAGMDDAAILAILDRDPEAFAAFYRRHARRLLASLARNARNERHAAELCAETFAVALCGAHRFDPARDDAAAWLDGISRRLLARADRRGMPDDRARKRLGMAALEPSATFVQELEEELVEAARFRASRRRPRPRPRVPARTVRAALAGAAALTVVVAALALGGRADRPQPPSAPSGIGAPLAAMLSAERCFGRAADDGAATPAMPDLSVFRYTQGVEDRLAADLGDSLPLATFQTGETRLAANGRRGTRLHVVPSLGVSADGRCAADDGPGVCLVADDGGRFRCFTLAAIRDGLAFVRTDRGSIAGIVPDGIGRVTLSAGGRRASGRVADNVYEAELGVPAGARVGVLLERPGETACAREVSPGLLHRVAALRRKPGERVLPAAALSTLREDRRIAEAVERGARFWGEAGGVEFWVVPVVAAARPTCAPADRVCVVALPDGGRAAAHCLLRPEWNREGWRIAPLYPGLAIVLAIVPDGVTGARAAIGDQAALVPAKRNVLAGMLPFPYDDLAPKRVEPTYARDPAKPRVGVVDAAGRQARYHPSYLLRRLGELGYPTVDAITPGVKPQPGTDLYWWPGRAHALDIGRLAEALGVDRVIRIGARDRAPLPVLRTDAPIVVVAGQGLPSPD
jgi:DNA-directed RNA polymerase specialized sigma24 family protein